MYVPPLRLVLEPGVQVFAVRFRPGMGAVFWRAAASDFANELMEVRNHGHQQTQPEHPVRTTG